MAAPKKSSKIASVKGQDDALPSGEDIENMRAPVSRFLLDARQERIRGYLGCLAVHPPQVLLLEGGNAGQRLAASLYWTLLLNCRQATQTKAPCLTCPECLRMITRQHRDCFFFDGRAGSIKIDDIRALLPVLGEPPREARFRLVVLCEAQSLGEAAANSLLKSLEEPRPGTSFVLSAPQRERLLATLVSRGFVLTLPWPDADTELPELSDGAAKAPGAPDTGSGATVDLSAWEADLSSFARSGTGLFERTAVRGAVDAPLVQAVSGLLRRSLVRRLSGRVQPVRGFDHLLKALPESRLRILDEALAECHDSLMLGVNPTLVLEWLMTRVHLLLPKR